MIFQKITYAGLNKQVEIVEFDSLQYVKDMLHQIFMTDPDVARYEELKMENGKTSVSLRDKGNRLIIQYKTNGTEQNSDAIH